MAKDYYDLLGVNKNASQEEVKKAYRKKAHQHHPDKGTGNEAKFKEINEAYQVLGDEKKRRQYDQFGSSASQNGSAGGNGFGGGGWEDIFRQAGQNAGGFEFDLGDLGDIFGFGGGRRQQRTGRVNGADMEMSMVIDFMEAVFGVEKELTLTKKTTCSHCSGNGAEPGSKITTCKTCNGTGQTVKMQRTILGNFQAVATCSDCSGEGKIAEKKCKKCQGVGVIEEAKKLKFRVPAGINDGETIRLSGEGEAGVKGGSTGDLYIHFKVKTHDKFRRQQDDILTTETVSISQAALGDKIDIATVNGKVNFKIPEGTQSGKVFKLKGEGVPHLRSSGKGDHLVEIKVQIPENLSKKQRELLEEFAKLEKLDKKKNSFWG